MDSRLKELRNYLGMSQEEFGKRINLSKPTISAFETRTRSMTDRVVSDICAQFDVNEDWLRNGQGDMILEPDTFSLDEFVKKQGASEFELDVVKCYFELGSEIRQAVVTHFKERLFNKDSRSEVSATIDNAATTVDSISEAEKEYKKNVLRSAPKQVPIVSNTIEEAEKKSV